MARVQGVRACGVCVPVCVRVHVCAHVRVSVYLWSVCVRVCLSVVCMRACPLSACSSACACVPVHVCVTRLCVYRLSGASLQMTSSCLHTRVKKTRDKRKK